METVLFVDDDDHIRRIYRKQLAIRGYAVRLAHDPISARYQAKKTPRIDFAIIDQCLKPGGRDISGLHLAKDLLDGRECGKILIHTGYPSVFAAFFAGSAGCVDYLLKPSSVEQMIAKLAGLGGDSIHVEPPSIELVTYEHAMRAVKDAGGNVSRAARALHVPLRTFQRMVARARPPR